MVGDFLGLLGGTLLAVWDIPFRLKYVAWYLAFAPVGGGALLFAWGNEVCSNVAEERAMLLGWLNTMGWVARSLGTPFTDCSRYVFNAWFPLVAYPNQQAPKFKYGYKVNAALWGIYLIGIPIPSRWYWPFLDFQPLLSVLSTMRPYMRGIKITTNILTKYLGRFLWVVKGIKSFILKG
jgi:hypothetical protein